jgi:hypothetical protein
MARQVVNVFRRAFELGCKGITVYRHGAKPGQVLSPISSPGLCPDCRNALEFAEGATLVASAAFRAGRSATSLRPARRRSLEEREFPLLFRKIYEWRVRGSF